MAGHFITLEGIEGAGKSTQTHLLVRSLEAAGFAVTRTREPGGKDRLGEALRALLKDPEIWRGLELAEVYLYAAARAHHVESVIRPAMEAGHTVVCDRYLDSTRTYQGYGRGRPLELIEALHAHPPVDLRPVRTILLDIEPALALKRARTRSIDEGAGYDDADLAFFERVRRGFLEIAARESERVLVIDAARSAELVHANIVSSLADLFPDLDPVKEPRR